MKMSQFISITLVIILGMFLNSCGQMTAEDEGMSSKSIEESSGTTSTTDDPTDTGTTTATLASTVISELSANLSLLAAQDKLGSHPEAPAKLSLIPLQVPR